jgi:hypothetical protein
MLDDSTAEGNMDLTNMQKSDRIRALVNFCLRDEQRFEVDNARIVHSCGFLNGPEAVCNQVRLSWCEAEGRKRAWSIDQ